MSRYWSDRYSNIIERNSHARRRRSHPRGRRHPSRRAQLSDDAGQLTDKAALDPARLGRHQAAAGGEPRRVRGRPDRLLGVGPHSRPIQPVRGVGRRGRRRPPVGTRPRRPEAAGRDLRHRPRHVGRVAVRAAGSRRSPSRAVSCSRVSGSTPPAPTTATGSSSAGSSPTPTATPKASAGRPPLRAPARRLRDRRGLVERDGPDRHRQQEHPHHRLLRARLPHDQPLRPQRRRVRRAPGRHTAVPAALRLRLLRRHRVSHLRHRPRRHRRLPRLPRRPASPRSASSARPTPSSKKRLPKRRQISPPASSTSTQ